jgi:phage host-nuclease inhibitor protein Gam
MTIEEPYALDPIGRTKNSPALNKAIIKAKAAFDAAASACKRNQSEIAGHYEDRTINYKTGTGAWQTRSKVLLANPDTNASLVLLAATNVLGPLITTFDPDTIWHTLADEHDIDLSHENRNKLLSAMLLIDMPVFLMDANVFATTVAAFAGEIPDTEILRPVTPAYLAWACIEADFVLENTGAFGTTLDREPRVYTAGCLHEYGMLVCPDVLTFAAEELKYLNRNGTGLSTEEVVAAWSETNKNDLTTTTFSETPLDIQLGKLASVENHLLDCLTSYTTACNSLI